MERVLSPTQAIINGKPTLLVGTVVVPPVLVLTPADPAVLVVMPCEVRSDGVS